MTPHHRLHRRGFFTLRTLIALAAAAPALGQGVAEWPAVSVSPTGAALVSASVGDFSVTNTGAATYSISLPVPPGRASPAPALALSYSSQGGNGPLGVGVSLSHGFPAAIARGRAIMARDGTIDPLDFDGNDRYYLDGKVLIFAGNNAAGESTFRTEVDSFVTLTQKRDSQGLVSGFAAVDRSGNKLLFGKLGAANDAYLSPPYDVNGSNGIEPGEFEPMAYSFAIKRVEDALGNSVDFSYARRNGEMLLATVEYGANSSLGIAAVARLKYVYDAFAVAGSTSRGDRYRSNYAGREVYETARLDQVVAETKLGSSYQIAGVHRFNYERSPDTRLTRLVSIDYYPRDPQTGSMRSTGRTTLAWSQGAYNVQSTTLATGSGSPLPYWGDAGGSYAFNNSKGFTPFCFGDFDGDGRVDYADARWGIYVTRSTGRGFAPRSHWLDSTKMPTLWRIASLPANNPDSCTGSILPADLNGDGRCDLLLVNDAASIFFVLSKPTGGFTDPAPVTLPTGMWVTPSNMPGMPPTAAALERGTVADRLTLADFTGDGMTDLMVHGYDGRIHLFRWNRTTNSFSASTVAGQGNPSQSNWFVMGWFPFHEYYGELREINVSPMTADLNGDGAADYIWIEKLFITTPVTSGATDNCMLQPRAAIMDPISGMLSSIWNFPIFQTQSYPGNYAIRDNIVHAFLPGDYTGDGLTDIMVLGSMSNLGPNRMNWTLYESEGAGPTGLPSFKHRKDVILSEFAAPDGQILPTHYNAVTNAMWTHIAKPLAMISHPTGMATKTRLMMSLGEHMQGMDVNRDGLDDLVWAVERDKTETSTANAGWWVAYSRGLAFDPPVRLQGAYWGNAPSPMQPNFSYTTTGRSAGHDLDGDGFADWTYSFNGALASFAYAAPGFPDLAVGFTNGLGSTTSVSYLAAKNNAIYTQGAPVAYPIRDVYGSNPVVSDVYKDAGGNSGATLRYSYQYSGNRLDISGRGSLGFHSFVTLDHQSKLISYQFLSQSFPMTGLVKREQTHFVNTIWPDANGGTLRLDLHPVSSQDNDVTFDEVNVPGQGLKGTVFPYMAHSQKLSWEHLASEALYIDTGNPESLFNQYNERYAANELRAHSRVNTYVWFDNQNQAATPSGALPYGFDENASYVPGQQDAVAVGFASWSAALQTIRNVSGANHGKITYGNLRKTRIDYGEDHWEETVSNYFTPTETVGFTSLLKDSKTTYGWTESGPTTLSTPTQRYTYWKSGAIQTGLVASQTTDAVDSKLDLVTTYIRDTRGRVTDTSISGYNSAGHLQHIGAYSVSKATLFDNRFDQPTNAEDAYQHDTDTVFHPYLGMPASVTDINGAATTYQYDALGRGAQVSQTLMNRQQDTSCVADASQTVSPPAGVPGVAATSAYRVSIVSTVQPTVHSYHDRLGRLLRVRKEAYGGQIAVGDTIYDVLGRPVAVSTLYPETDVSQRYWTVTAYDDLGRPETVTAPNGTVTTHTYHGRASRSSVDAGPLGGVDPAPQVTTSLADARGNTIKVWNADNVPALSSSPSGYKGLNLHGESLRYQLDGMGRMRQTAMKGIARSVKVEYDELGNQILLDDPDKGRWQYVYDSLGRLRKQTNAKGDITYLGYDRLGRKTYSRIDERGDGTTQQHARWHYYESAAKPDANVTVATAAQGAWLGALQRSEIDYNPNPSTGAFLTADHANAFTYTAKGQERLNLHAVDGKHFYAYANYDTYGRAISRDYQWRPANLESDLASSTWNRYGLTYAYDSKSYLTQVSDSDGKVWWAQNTNVSYPKTYDLYDAPVFYQKGDSSYGWTGKAYTPNNRALRSILTGTASQASGSSASVQNWIYRWDGLGNLTGRSNPLQGGVETFGYDNLNRLITRNGAAIATYDQTGNIAWKKNVSGYAGTYEYDLAGPRPHAVNSATYHDGAPTSVDIVYDPNGNMIGRRISDGVSGTIWTAAWTAFDKPKFIARQGVGSAFHYDAEGRRAVQVEFDNVSGGVGHHTDKKLYAGPQMEIDYKNASPSGSVPTWQLDRVRVYVDGPDGRTGAREWKASTGAAERLVYHQDHLGSVDAISLHGAATAALAPDRVGKSSLFSYDPWGERRDPADWLGKPSATSGSDPKALLSPRGYTDHEMLDEIGLVHMNGRIYDPLLGRFLSADTLIDGAGSLQGYNRYSYVHNNPLSSTDPSGYSAMMMGEIYRSRPATYAQIRKHAGPAAANKVEAIDRAVDQMTGAYAAGAVFVGLTMIPLVGEVMDVGAAVVDPANAGLYMSSTAGNMGAGLTAPNASGVRLAGNLMDSADDAMKALKKLDDAVDTVKDAAVRTDAKAMQKVDSETPATIEAEKASSKKLRQNLVEAGRPVGQEEAAHHIVAGNDPRAEPARQRLQQDAVEINSAANGVGLPQNTSSSNPEGKSVHSTIHTNENYDKVNEAIVNAPEGEVEAVLERLRKQQEGGTF